MTPEYDQSTSVKIDFLSELGLEKGEGEQNSWDSEVLTHSNSLSWRYFLYTIDSN